MDSTNEQNKTFISLIFPSERFEGCRRPIDDLRKEGEIGGAPEPKLIANGISRLMSA